MIFNSVDLRLELKIVYLNKQGGFKKFSRRGSVDPSFKVGQLFINMSMINVYDVPSWSDRSRSGQLAGITIIRMICDG